MFFLNEKDVFHCGDYQQIMASIEDAYRAYQAGTYNMPLRSSLEMQNENTLLLMPCVNEFGFGTKILTLFPGNRGRGKPYIDGLVLVHNNESGEIEAMLDAKSLTALRTGAVGGVAMSHLAAKDADSLGVIGCGMQGLYQAIYGAKVCRLKRINIFDHRPEIMDSFVERLTSKIDPTTGIHICQSRDELVENSRIIVTTTTSNVPVIPDERKIVENKCFVGIGSYKPQMVEMSRAVIESSEAIYVDTEHALEESGDLIIPMVEGWIPREKISLFSEVLGKKDFVPPKTVFFKSVGMALFDLHVAQKIVEIASKKGIGQHISA